jgi:ribosomal protein S18 acetylase RimI-like enzyme
VAASSGRARIAERAAPRLWVAAPEEAETVAELIAAFRDWWGYSAPGDAALRASVERLIADPSTEFLLGALPPDAPSGDAPPGDATPPAGVCQLRFRHSVWTGSDDAWLEDLYVRDDTRGSGLGRALTEFAIERARARGCGRIQLDANSANGPASRLYESLGFSARQDPPGGDALMMTRKLS